MSTVTRSSRWRHAAPAIAFSLFIGHFAGAQQAPPEKPAAPAAAAETKAEAPASPAITGLWRQGGGPGESETLKFIYDGYWSLTQRGANGFAVTHHGGTFTLEGDVYTEKVAWAGTSSRGLIGSSNSFRVAVEGDTCRLQGLNNKWSGTWTRVKAGAPGDTPAPAPDPAAKRKADIEFLLTEFPKRAARLIETKKIDWDKVSAWCRAEAEKVQTDEDHLRLCQRLLARLQDGHARLEGTRVTFPDDSHGRPSAPPPVQLIPGKDSILVLSATEEAAAAGAKPGAVVTQIDGRPAREWLEAKVDEWTDKFCYSTRHHALATAARWGLGGREGTALRLSVKTDDGEKTVDLTRRAGSTPANFTPAQQLPALQNLGRHSYGRTADGYGYIRLGNTPGDLPQQLDTMLESIGEVPGMILDMRGNSGGGCDHREVFGRFLQKEALWGTYESKGPHPFAGPMIVILDANCASAGETVGGQFGEDQRAYMIGATPTAGMSSQKTRIPAPSGLFTAYISIGSNKGRFNRGRGIEGIGVQPHEFTFWESADLAAGIDTQIRRACEILKAGIPAGAIDYVPPAPAPPEAAAEKKD